jgi:hypothetical protein
MSSAHFRFGERGCCCQWGLALEACEFTAKQKMTKNCPLIVSGLAPAGDELMKTNALLTSIRKR